MTSKVLEQHPVLGAQLLILRTRIYETPGALNQCTIAWRAAPGLTEHSLAMPTEPQHLPGL